MCMSLGQSQSNTEMFTVAALRARRWKPGFWEGVRCVCVCEGERKRERESVCVRERERECVCVRERECVCV